MLMDVMDDCKISHMQVFCMRQITHGGGMMLMDVMDDYKISHMEVYSSREMLGKVFLLNSFAFGSAPRREADSQPISQLNRPAVSQTETHSLGCLSVADTAAHSAETSCSQDWQRPNGNAGGHRLFGRWFEPRRDQHSSGVAAGVCRPGVEPPT